MKRKVEHKEVEIITYTVSRKEMVNAIIRTCTTDGGLALPPLPTEIVGLPDSVDFVYEYAKKDDKAPATANDDQG